MLNTCDGDIDDDDLFELQDLFVTVRDRELRAFNRVVYAERHLAKIKGAKDKYLAIIADLSRADLREMMRMRAALIREAMETGSIKETRLRVSRRTNYRDPGWDDDGGSTPDYARVARRDDSHALMRAWGWRQVQSESGRL